MCVCLYVCLPVYVYVRVCVFLFACLFDCVSLCLCFIGCEYSLALNRVVVVSSELLAFCFLDECIRTGSAFVWVSLSMSHLLLAQIMQVNATTLRIIRVARCLMLPCTACSSATSCKDCMSLSGSADCFWLSAFSDPIIGQGGVCVGATDGLTLRYPFYTPNMGCTPASLCVSSNGVCASSRVRKQCSYATTTSCQKCVTSGCFWQSNFISTCVVIFARSRVCLCVCMCVSGVWMRVL